MKKEMIKAVRMVNGFTPDLRIKLDYKKDSYTAQEVTIRDFLLDHLTDIFGVGIFDRLGIKFNPQPGEDSEDYQKLLDFIGRESRQVLLGQPAE